MTLNDPGPYLPDILASAVLLLRASTYSGSGAWLNEGTGGTALNAVADGSPVWANTAGRAGFTLADGSSGTPDAGPYFSVPDSALLRPGVGSATIAARFKTLEAATEALENIIVMLEGDIGAGGTFWGMWDSVGFLDAATAIVANAGSDPGTNPTWAVASTNLTVGEHLMVMRIDRDATPDTMTLYVDGTAAGTADISGVTSISPSHEVIIGRANKQIARTYAYWNRALTAAELQRLTEL